MKFSHYLKIWCLAFAYTLLAGLFIQLVLLVYIFPQWNAGAGMLSSLDSPYYHDIALDLYHKMLSQGWSAWQFSPSKQIVSGISAIFYYLIAPQPWSVLPLQAALNASACLGIYFMLSSLEAQPRTAFLALLPFLFFPSALQWNSQIANDVYSIPGVILFIGGWAAIFTDENAGWKKSLLYVGLLLAGLVLACVPRPYLGLPMDGLSAVLGLVYLGRSIPALRKDPSARGWRVGLILALGLVVAGLLPVARAGLTYGSGPHSQQAVCQPGDEQPKCAWRKSRWLPGFIDNEFKQLSQSRYQNLRQWQVGVSNLDVNVKLDDAASMIRYMPRAMQIALLAPFPNMWFGTGSLPANTLMRRVSAVEMSIVYLCLLGLIPAFYFWRKKSALYVILLICAAFLLLFGLDVPNIGTLYRFRFPFLMSLVTVGLYGWLVLIGTLRRGRQTASAVRTG